MLLAAWPRGTGRGELLWEPEIDDTPARERGVDEAWWAAVVSRAPWVPTRLFVEAFVKPFTLAASVAIYFFIPPAFRSKPAPPRGVFVSHAWMMSTKEFFEVCLANMGDDDYGWIDIFVYPQFGEGDGSTATWIDRFDSLIVGIGKVVSLCTSSLGASCIRIVQVCCRRLR